MVPQCLYGGTCENSHSWYCKSWLKHVPVGPQSFPPCSDVPSRLISFPELCEVWYQHLRKTQADAGNWRFHMWWLRGLLTGKKRCSFLWDYLLHISTGCLQAGMPQLQKHSPHLHSARASSFLTYHLNGKQYITPWHLLNSLHLNMYFEESIFLIKLCLLGLPLICMCFLWIILILPDTEQSNFSEVGWTKWKSIVQFGSSLSDKQHIL